MLLWQACSRRRDKIIVVRRHFVGYRRGGGDEGSGGDKHIVGGVHQLSTFKRWWVTHPYYLPSQGGKPCLTLGE